MKKLSSLTCFAILYSSLYNFKEQKSQCFLVALMKISMIINIFELPLGRVNFVFFFFVLPHYNCVEVVQIMKRS